MSKSKLIIRNRNSRVRSPYPLVSAPDKSLTQQQFKNECDMNRIVANSQRGIPPRYLAKGTPHYGDFTANVDLTAAYNTISAAEEAFMALPSGLRAELHNDPVNLASLTADQIARYKLGKNLPTPGSTPPSPASPEAGQAVPPEPASDKKAQQK